MSLSSLSQYEIERPFSFIFRQWDGLLTAENTRIMVLGATNRPNDIDPAILRRMPKRFAIRLPDREQRKKILDLVRSLSIARAPKFGQI